MKSITAAELKKALEEKSEKILLVDVRETDEIREEASFLSGVRGYVNFPLSVIRMIPGEELKQRFEELSEKTGIPFTEARIILFCRSGARSCIAQEVLALYGIDTESLEGGNAGWL